jgi:hypothetical protein
MNASSAQYVQYGCGLSAPPEWINFDCSPTLRAERFPVVRSILAAVRKPLFPDNVRFGDIIRGLPLPSRSCRGIYCCHVLEHLSYHDFEVALANTLKLLTPGGVFRCVLPDIRALAAGYLRSEEEDACIRFMSSTHLGTDVKPRGFRSFMQNWLGNSRHLWMWDERGVRQKLRDAGFIDIRPMKFGDSEDKMFQLVEHEERFLYSVCLEARRCGSDNT